MKKQLSSPNFYKLVLIFLILWLLFSFIAINRHSKSNLFSYQSEFWADKAGYMVYLPMTFHFQWKNAAMPDSMVNHSGKGFLIQDRKVISKYPVGAALMVAPFYFVAHSMHSASEETFFIGRGERWAMNIAAAFWLCVGLFSLYKALKFHYDKKLIIAAIVILVLGTNLFYYTVFEGTMSHVYSFSLFSMLWCVLEKIKRNSSIASHLLLCFATLGTLIFLVRPINVLFIPIVLMLVFSNHFSQLKNSIRNMKVFTILFGVLISFLLLFPQLLYWKYASGHWLFYAYGNETFSNLFKPQIIKVLLSTNNGLLVYTPVWLFVFGFVIYKIWRSSYIYFWVGLIFLLMLMICSTWHDPYFGCSYGQRNFVDISCFFAFVFAGFLKEISSINKLAKAAFLITIAIFVLLNLKLIFSYDYCWYGGTWDFKAVGKLIVSPLK
jgi:hypothetical protein